jgi:hypothetical protein
MQVAKMYLSADRLAGTVVMYFVTEDIYQLVIRARDYCDSRNVPTIKLIYSPSPQVLVQLREDTESRVGRERKQRN